LLVKKSAVTAVSLKLIMSQMWSRK